eukprot:m.724808 g.724808  ORF g.724808 m.724808 type:complete len:380 (+) comp23025_c2_seq2:402-1541(+)
MMNRSGEEVGRVYRHRILGILQHDAGPFVQNINGRNVAFYRNEIPCRPDNLRIEEIFETKYDDHEWLEDGHGYIQWLFPIRENGVNPLAQRLHPQEALLISTDPTCKSRVLRSYKLFLNFLGIQVENDETGAVARSPRYEERFRNLLRNGHNLLRISRMIQSIGELGFAHFQVPLLEFFMHEIFATGALELCGDSLRRYWMHLVLDDVARGRIMDECSRQRPIRRRTALDDILTTGGDDEYGLMIREIMQNYALDQAARHGAPVNLAYTAAKIDPVNCDVGNDELEHDHASDVQAPTNASDVHETTDTSDERTSPHANDNQAITDASDERISPDAIDVQATTDASDIHATTDAIDVQAIADANSTSDVAAEADDTMCSG